MKAIPCDLAAVSKCQAPWDRAMPDTGTILGERKENEWSSQAIRASTASSPAAHEPLSQFSLWVWLTLPLVPMENVCGCAKYCYVRAWVLGTRGREKPDTLDSPPSTVGESHEDTCSSGFLLSQVIFPTTLPKVFGGFPFLGFLIGPFFLVIFFSCSEEMKQFP